MIGSKPGSDGWIDEMTNTLTESEQEQPDDYALLDTWVDIFEDQGIQ